MIVDLLGTPDEDAMKTACEGARKHILSSPFRAPNPQRIIQLTQGNDDAVDLLTRLLLFDPVYMHYFFEFCIQSKKTVQENLSEDILHLTMWPHLVRQRPAQCQSTTICSLAAPCSPIPHFVLLWVLIRRSWSYRGWHGLEVPEIVARYAVHLRKSILISVLWGFDES